MPVDKTRRRPRVSPAGSEWSTPRTRLVHRLSPGLSTGVEGWDTPLRKRPHTLPRTGIHLLEHALGLTRATPLPCTGGPVAVDPARPRWATPPPAHQRSGTRHHPPRATPPAPFRAPEVRTPPRGDNWATRLPALVREVVGAGSSPSTGAHREVPPRHPLAPALAPGPCCPVEAAGGRSEAGGSRKGDAPSSPHPDARSDRGARRRTASGRHRGPGSGRGRREPSGSMRARPRTSLRARSSPRVLRRGRGWAVVTMRRARAAEHAPPRARLGRWRAVRRLKKVAGAYLSPLAPRHFRPEVAQ